MTSGFSWGFEWATPSAMQCFHKRCHQGCGLRTRQTDMGCTTCFLPPHQSCPAQLQKLEQMASDAEGGRHLSQQRPCRSHKAHRRQPKPGRDEDWQNQHGRQCIVPAPSAPNMCLPDQSTTMRSVIVVAMPRNQRHDGCLLRMGYSRRLLVHSCVSPERTA